MANNNTNLYRTQATGVFHTDGLGGANPNNPAPAYAGLTTTPTDRGFDVTAGHIQLTEFNQRGQFYTNGIAVTPNQAGGPALTQTTHPYGPHVRQSS